MTSEELIRSVGVQPLDPQRPIEMQFSSGLNARSPHDPQASCFQREHLVNPTDNGSSIQDGKYIEVARERSPNVPVKVGIAMVESSAGGSKEVYAAAPNQNC